MRGQGGGQIYNVEGFGSAGIYREGMSVYGATKRAVRYFTRSLVNEVKKSPVLVCTIVPGIVATEMLAEQYATASPRRKRLYDAAADLPETVGRGLAPRILANRRNGAVIAWIGPWQIVWRLLSPAYAKRGVMQRAGRPGGER